MKVTDVSSLTHKVLGTEATKASSYIQTPAYSQYNLKRWTGEYAIVCHPTCGNGAHSRTATENNSGSQPIRPRLAKRELADTPDEIASTTRP